MILDKSTVDVLLNACVNEGVLICADKRTFQGVWNDVYGASVTDDDANRMEEFLNSTCSERALTELIDVLEGKAPLDPALREVARLISRNKEDKIDFQTRRAFLRALEEERNSGCPNKKVIEQNEKDLEEIETASKATLILFVERLITEEFKIYLFDTSGSLMGEGPSQKLREGLRIRADRIMALRRAVRAQLMRRIALANELYTLEQCCTACPQKKIK